MRSKKRKNNVKMGYKIVVVAIFIILVAAIINLAPNYVRTEVTGKVNVIINNNNVTESMKFDAFTNEKNVVYISTKDIANFFDEDIFYDNVYDQIITTSDTKLATLKIDDREIMINGANVKLAGAAVKKDNQFYLPFSELGNVYNVEINYIEDTNILTVDSLDREQKRGNASKNISVKYKPTIFSKTVDKVKKGNSVYVIEENNNGWIKVRTSSGKIGYTKDVANIYTTRENIEIKKQIDGKVSMAWDAYYTNSLPERTGTINGINVISPTVAELVRLGQGEMNIKAGATAKNYVEWAHNNNYKVWAMVSNGQQPQTTSEILSDYKLREKLINQIIDMVLQYNFDGINLDFENVKAEDKDKLSRFIIELAPRLREYGRVLSVDVTAPDGGTDWSESYDRNKIGKAADYIVFMAYDQYGGTASKAGTIAGADWVEVNIKKFIDREEVKPEKIILGMPFYTRLWEETESKAEGTVITIKNIDRNIPPGVQKQWKEDEKQNYIEYNRGNITYKMWIEDETSLKAKFDLMRNYNLGGAAYWERDYATTDIWNFVADQIK